MEEKYCMTYVSQIVVCKCFSNLTFVVVVLIIVCFIIINKDNITIRVIKKKR